LGEEAKGWAAIALGEDGRFDTACGKRRADGVGVVALVGAGIALHHLGQRFQQGPEATHYRSAQVTVIAAPAGNV
jgi:hypothetical protein